MIIYLTGFMGSGKSHWGKIWAEELGYHFVDMDELIEEELGMNVQEIFATKGEEFFRQKEADLLRSITNKKLIVATGGGVPAYHQNMEWMNRHGLTVYIQAKPETILERLKGETGERPLFNNVPEDNKPQFIKEKLEERQPYYKMAQVHLHGEKLSPESLASFIKNE